MNACLLEREFEVDEATNAIFELGGAKAWGPDCYPIAFFQQFWPVLEEDVMDFLKEFQSGEDCPRI